MCEGVVAKYVEPLLAVFLTTPPAHDMLSIGLTGCCRECKAGFPGPSFGDRAATLTGDLAQRPGLSATPAYHQRETIAINVVARFLKGLDFFRCKLPHFSFFPTSLPT